MTPLRFLHQFFVFSVAEKNARWGAGDPTWDEAEEIYRNDRLPRRSLTISQPGDFAGARDLFESVLREEQDLGILVDQLPDFPPAVREYIPESRLPVFLYRRGRIVPPLRGCVAMVGTRKPSPLGVDTAASFAAYFSRMDLIVVSGLAKGIDSVAHRENIACGTVAVLGSDVGRVYPRENQRLAEEILRKGGTLVSPFPLYQIPLPQNFPARNEIIAAICAGTVVIEGAEQSGAAITGLLALAMSKCVVALPQDFRTDFGRGAIRLQQAGAVLATNEEEALQAIYSAYGGFAHKDQAPIQRTFSFGEFQLISGKSVPEAIVLLEEGILRGRIERLGPQRYRFSNPARSR